jgi:hypothetical protein
MLVDVLEDFPTGKPDYLRSDLDEANATLAH